MWGNVRRVSRFVACVLGLSYNFGMRRFSGLGAVLGLLGLGFLGCLGCRNLNQSGAGLPAVPPLLAMAPSDAAVIVWLPDLAAAVQGAADYGTKLLAGTGWAITAERHANWRQTYGFSPLDPNSYRNAGINVGAGALVLIQAPQDKPLLALKIADPNRFESFMRASQTVQGVPPQRTERVLGGHTVISWQPAGEDAPATHCVFMEDYVFADSDAQQLENFVQRLPQAPSLGRDAAALALQQRIPPGQMLIWSRPSSAATAPWTLSSTRLDRLGLTSHSFEARGSGASAAQPNALSLPALLQRIDPLSFAVLAVGASGGSVPWKGGVDSSALEEAFGERTGLSLKREVLPQIGEAMTAGIRWLNLAPPEGGWGINLRALLLQIEAGATLEVRDGAAVSKLLERVRAHLLADDAPVERAAQSVGGETVQVYTLHPLGRCVRRGDGRASTLRRVAQSLGVGGGSARLQPAVRLSHRQAGAGDHEPERGLCCQTCAMARFFGTAAPGRFRSGAGGLGARYAECPRPWSVGGRFGHPHAAPRRCGHQWPRCGRRDFGEHRTGLCGGYFAEPLKRFNTGAPNDRVCVGPLPTFPPNCDAGAPAPRTPSG